MEKLYELVHSEEFDIVVVDTPPTRNALDLLDAPRRLTRFLENRLFRAILVPTRMSLRAVGVATQALLRTISKVAGAEIVQDAVGFFQAFEGMEDGFRSRASAVHELLADPATAYVLVTSARPDAITEAGFFAEKLAERDVAVAALVVNRIAPSFGDGRGARRRRAGAGAAMRWRPTWRPLDALAAPRGAGVLRAGGAGGARPRRPHSALRRRRARAPRVAAGGRPTLPLSVVGRVFGGRGRSDSVPAVQTILVASDAPTLRADVEAVISGPDIEVRAVTSGPEVVAFVAEESPDLLIVDMQMGNMGGMAVCLELRLQESYDALDHVSVLMLLDRRPDVFLARRSDAEGWLVKPLDPLRLRRAVAALLDGGTFADDSFTPVPVLVGGGAPAAGGARAAALTRRCRVATITTTVAAARSAPTAPGGAEHLSQSLEAEASEQERFITEALADLRDMDVREVMTPRVDVTYLTIPVQAEDIAQAVRTSGHSCFPVVHDDLDDLIGILFVNDIFRTNRPGSRAPGGEEPRDATDPSPLEISRKVRQPYLLPETLGVLEALADMRKHRRAVAVVVDEYGGVAGLLTVKDLLEPLVGDLSDEFDEEEEAPHRAGRQHALAH